MFAGEWNVISRPNNKVVGPNGVLMGTEDGVGIISPTALDGLALWLDAIDQNSLLASDGSVIEDGEAVALWSDKSGNSAENVLLLPGSGANSASLPKQIPSSGIFEITAHARPASYTVAATPLILAGVWKSSTSDRSWRFDFGDPSTSNALRFLLSSVGSATAAIVVSSAIPADGTEWFRATVDLDNGTVDFYTSTDGVTWSALGVQQSYTPLTLFDATSDLVIGDTGEKGGGAVRQATYYSLIGTVDGTSVFDIDFTAQAKLATSFTESSSNAATVTINTSGATGARISGARDLYQGTVANRPVFLKYNGEKYGYLNGVSGNYFSTPDSAALSPTNEFEVIAHVQRSPGDNYYLIAQDDGGANRAYYIQINSSGNIVVRTVDSIGGVIFATSTEALPSGYSFIRVTVEQDNGSNNAVNYYTGGSISGPWTPLGSEVTGPQRQNIVSKSNDIWIGRQSSNYSSGLIKYLSFSTTIGGSPTAVFDVSRYTSGSTFTASTGETWTLNGGSHIVQRTGLYFDGSNDYLKSASFSLSQPESVYFIGEQVSWTGPDSLFDGQTSSTMQVYQDTAEGAPNVSLYGGTVLSTNGDFSLRSASALFSGFNGLNSSLRVNRLTALSGDGGALAAGGFTLGCRAVPDRYSNIFVSELPIYSAAHDTATQDRVALYAGKKWGIAV